MATTAMSAMGYRDILIREGFHAPYTMIVNGADVFPGMPVTATGPETYPDVCLPDGIGDSVVGVTGLLENQDIDTVYANNAEVPVYLTGHGAILRVYHAPNGGDVVFGDIMCAQGLDAIGYVEPLHHAMEATLGAAETAISSLLATQLEQILAIMGRAQETLASSGVPVPIKICLSI